MNDAAERYEAMLADDFDEELALQDAIADEEERATSHRCTDRMCGALDCSNCYP